MVGGLDGFQWNGIRIFVAFKGCRDTLGGVGAFGLGKILSGMC